MRVRFRTYCPQCRIGARGPRSPGLFPPPRHRHVWLWDYYITEHGRRWVQRGGFRTKARAESSARRSWAKLSAALAEHSPT